MRKLSLSLLTLSLGVALLPLAQAATTPAQEHLLEQVRLGEASNREDLVRQSLYRLELIDPNNPELIAARMRYLLRQGDAAGAQKELERLTKLAPDSPELKASRNEMKSNTGEGRQALQQARLLGVAGKVDEAIAAYEKLYGGVPDDVDVAIEYWTLVARLPARHSEGVSQLKKLNASAPGNVSLLTSLAKQMFADNKPQEGFAYLAEMARSASGRGIAADMWFSEVKSMPVSKASVQALQQFLLQFPTGSVAANARVLLDQQQAQLQDPLSAPARKGWRRSSPGIPRRRSRICRKPFRPTAATATRWALSARPIPSAATARGQWRSSVKRLPWTLTARTAASGTACCKLTATGC